MAETAEPIRTIVNGIISDAVASGDLSLGVLVGVLMSGLSAAGLALDGAFERFLVRRGVRRPLLVMGATGLVVGWRSEDVV